MGNLQLGASLQNEADLIPKQLDTEDPKIKAIIEEAVKGQEAILKMKEIDPQSMRVVIKL